MCETGVPCASLEVFLDFSLCNFQGSGSSLGSRVGKQSLRWVQFWPKQAASRRQHS